MPLLFARAAVVPFWMIAVALIAVLGPPGGPGVRDLLLLLGLTLVASALLALVASAFRARLPVRTRHASVLETGRATDVEPGSVPPGDRIVARRASGVQSAGTAK